MTAQNDPLRDTILQVVSANGGSLAGTTRLQKTVFLLQHVADVPLFDFYYHHYGPYSADVAAAVGRACEAGLLSASERSGYSNMNYVMYETATEIEEGPFDRKALSDTLAELDSVDALVLEVAATWLFLEREEGYSRSEALENLRQLKPSKASNKRVREADHLLTRLGLH